MYHLLLGGFGGRGDSRLIFLVLKWYAAGARGKNRSWDVGHDKTGTAAKCLALLNLCSWHTVLSARPQISRKMLNMYIWEGKREESRVSLFLQQGRLISTKTKNNILADFHFLWLHFILFYFRYLLHVVVDLKTSQTTELHEAQNI